jgi:signal peptidase I
MNKQKIIKSVKTGRRDPAAAFFMSLAVTGLGQVYNGRYSAGAALFLLRAVSEFIVPAYIHARPEQSYIDFFAAALSFNIIIVLISPIEALAFSLKNREVQLKKWNSVPVYAVFSLLNILVLTAGLLVNSVFFSISAFPGEKSSLLFNPADIVLVKKYTSSVPGRGEYIIYHEDGARKASRITGTEGDTVEISSRSLVVNSVPSRIRIPDEKLPLKGGLTGEEDLYLETAGPLTYPVKMDFAPEKGKEEKRIITPGNGELLLVDDDRKQEVFYRVIKREEVVGRIEGVVFSGEPGRLFLKPFVIVR